MGPVAGRPRRLKLSRDLSQKHKAGSGWASGLATIGRSAGTVSIRSELSWAAGSANCWPTRHIMTWRYSAAGWLKTVTSGTSPVYFSNCTMQVQAEVACASREVPMSIESTFGSPYLQIVLGS